MSRGARVTEEAYYVAKGPKLPKTHRLSFQKCNLTLRRVFGVFPTTGFDCLGLQLVRGRFGIDGNLISRTKIRGDTLHRASRPGLRSSA